MSFVFLKNSSTQTPNLDSSNVENTTKNSFTQTHDLVCFTIEDMLKVLNSTEGPQPYSKPNTKLINFAWSVALLLLYFIKYTFKLLYYACISISLWLSAIYYVSCIKLVYFRLRKNRIHLYASFISYLFKTLYCVSKAILPLLSKIYNKFYLKTLCFYPQKNKMYATLIKYFSWMNFLKNTFKPKQTLIPFPKKVNSKYLIRKNVRISNLRARKAINLE